MIFGRRASASKLVIKTSAPGILVPAADSQEASIRCLRGIVVVVSRYSVVPLCSLPRLFRLALWHEQAAIWSSWIAGTDPLEILFTSFSHVRVCDTASKCRSSYTDVQRVSFPPSYLFFRLSRFSIPRLGIEMETSLRSRPVISRIGDERR